jgi:DNA-binding NarL/FixJ family response regulator
MVERFAAANGLSGQETAVLLLTVKGVHRKEAASRLGCTTGTVDTYWRRIFKKTLRTSQCEVLVALLAFALAPPSGKRVDL